MLNSDTPWVRNDPIARAIAEYHGHVPRLKFQTSDVPGQRRKLYLVSPYWYPIIVVTALDLEQADDDFVKWDKTDNMLTLHCENGSARYRLRRFYALSGDFVGFIDAVLR